MKVAFMMAGKDSNTKLINTIKASADNIEFFTYGSIQGLIKDSRLRHLFFDRIIVSEKFMVRGRADLEDLNSYIIEDSDSTDIILVCKPNESVLDKDFLEIFNAPMYTPVLISSVVQSTLMSLITSDIVELKTKFYTLEEGKGQSKVASGGSADLKKSGIFGKIRGKKNSDDKSGTDKKEEEVIQYGESSTENVPNESSKETAPIISGFGAFGGLGGASVSATIDDSIHSELSSLIEPVSVGVTDIGVVNSTDDDDLSIGTLGSTHSDTGFLDDDAEKELEEYANAQIVSEPIRQKPRVVQKPKVQKPREVERTSGVSNIHLLVGSRGVGVSEEIINTAVEKKNLGKSVLVIDLDYRYNGVLSYMDIERFYLSGCNMGIEKSRVYSEDGVDVLSNGYASNINSSDVLKILNSPLVRGYDVIFLDCPLDCLDVISKEIIDKSDIRIIVNGNIGSMLVTSLGLSSSIVSPYVSDALMKTNKILVKNKIAMFKDDLLLAKKLCYLPNGNWLNNIR